MTFRSDFGIIRTMKIEEVIAAADELAHICANIGGYLDVAEGGSAEGLTALCQQSSKKLVKAAEEYWKAKGTDEDGMPQSLEEKPSKQENTIHIEAHVRYPEDAAVNGKEEDKDLPTMPYLANDPSEGGWVWNLSIDADTGEVIGWPKGTVGQSYYKVCDECKVTFGSINYDCYVPDFLEIDDKGFGDYIYITIQTDGRIKGWDKTRFYNWVEEQKKA